MDDAFLFDPEECDFNNYEDTIYVDPIVALNYALEAIGLLCRDEVESAAAAFMKYSWESGTEVSLFSTSAESLNDSFSFPFCPESCTPKVLLSLSTDETLEQFAAHREFVLQSQNISSNLQQQQQVLEDQKIHFKDFPCVEMKIEKCEGTVEELLLNNYFSKFEEKEAWDSLLGQIAVQLHIYQTLFSFTHNDLHCANVMYVKTSFTSIYYDIGDGNVFHIPVVDGYIYKIVDYGRAAFKVNNLWVMGADAYSPWGEVCGLFNCGPFLQAKHAIKEPNLASDLVHFAYDFYITLLTNIANEDCQLVRNDEQYCPPFLKVAAFHQSPCFVFYKNFSEPSNLIILLIFLCIRGRSVASIYKQIIHTFSCILH